MGEELNNVGGGRESRETQDLWSPSDKWITPGSLRDYILTSKSVQLLDRSIAAQFGAKLGELWEYNIVSLVNFFGDLHLNSIGDIDALLQFNIGRILQVADVERSAFQTMVPRGFSLFILSYIVAAKRLKTEQALEAWLDGHFTGHAVEQHSFACKLMSAALGADGSVKEGSNNGR